MTREPTYHPVWVFIPAGTQVWTESVRDRKAGGTTSDCTTIVYRRKLRGRWQKHAYTEHEGVPGFPFRVFLDWTKCKPVKPNTRAVAT